MQRKNVRKIAKIAILSVIAFVIFFSSIPVANADFIFQNIGGITGIRRANIPQQYTVEHVINDLGEVYGYMDSPEDIYICARGYIYVVDQGNNRIIVFNPDFTIRRVITETYGIPPNIDTPTYFNQPSGIYVHPDGDIFLADTMNERILHMNEYGRFVEMFVDPESQLLYSIVNEFKPTKLSINMTGYIYIIRRHDLMSMDADNRFRGLTVSGQVEFSLTQLFARIFYTQEQQDRMFRPAPPPFTNFMIHKDGLIYATTLDQRRGQIKRLNWVGQNTLPEKQYGVIARRADGSVRQPYFVDIAVDRYNIIYAVEKYNGYVYRYDTEGNLLGVFGGIGEVRGRFREPSSIEVDDRGNIYVLDKIANNLQVFQPTGFTMRVTAAVDMYQQGLYEEAYDLWTDILDVAGNYYVAHMGTARAFFKKEMWREAMDHFTKAGDREGYSEAFRELRHEILRAYFGLIVLAAIGIVVLLVWIMIRLNWFSEDVVDYY